MKLRTRLMVTFLIIVVLPILLTSVAYSVVRIATRQNIRESYGVENVSMSLISNPVEGFSELTDAEYEELKVVAQTAPEQFSNKEFLEQTNQLLTERASCLVLVQNGEIIYNGGKLNPEVYEFLADSEKGTDFGNQGHYLDGLEVLIKQINYQSPDGVPAQAYIVTTVKNIVSGSLLLAIVLVVIVVLIVTGLFLTRWIRSGVFVPLTQLNVAMQHIADGDFDYVMEAKGTGEIASLYENYNQMRLRLKESAEEKVQADRQNRELISNISHDLKTPITSIKGYVEGIMDGVADTPEKMDRYIKTIYNKANDMNRLINELTIYSGIDSNRIPYNFHKLNVADYFNDCVEEVGLDLESKSIRLNYINMVSPDTVVIADPEQLKRVINNIVGNSVKYMNKPNGEIDIRILDEIDSIRVEIEDNGKGVSPKEIGRIFERFYRTDASRNSSQGGSGIGLSIVKKIIEDHGGYIWATSKEN